jgi:hypothetical protein
MKERGKSFLFLQLILLFVLIIVLSLVSAGTLKVTEEHPFLVNGEWISASQLRVGDVLQTIDGKNVTIKKITPHETSEPFSVYNLEAGIFHDFVVADSSEPAGEEVGVVVHNSENPFREVIYAAKNDLTELHKANFIQIIRELDTFAPPYPRLDRGALRAAEIDAFIANRHLPIAGKESFLELYTKMELLGYKFIIIENLPSKVGASGIVVHTKKWVILDGYKDITSGLYYPDYSSLAHEIEHFRDFKTYVKLLGTDLTSANQEYYAELYFNLKKQGGTSSIFYSQSKKKFSFDPSDFVDARETEMSVTLATELNAHLVSDLIDDSLNGVSSVSMRSLLTRVRNIKSLECYNPDNCLSLKSIKPSNPGVKFNFPSSAVLKCPTCKVGLDEVINLCPHCGIDVSGLR